MFAPILPGTSLASWTYLQSSQSKQMQVFGKDPQISRENSHFVDAIKNMTSVDDLMKDYLSLKVALGAHGLREDIKNRFFVQQVIEQGVTNESSFANKLSDIRYSNLAQTFETLGLTGSGSISTTGDISDALGAAITSRFGTSPLYKNTGAKLEGNLRLGLLGSDSAEKVWTRAITDPGLAESLAKILGAAGSLSTLDTKGQVATLRDATDYLYGGTSLSTLVDPDNAYAVADAYLGTAGQTLESGFSYGGLRDRFGDILSTITSANTPPTGGETAAQAVDNARWSALQQDSTLRDILAQVVGVSAGFSSLSAAGQVAELKTKTAAYFGRSDFTLFEAQANITEIGDRYRDPNDSPLTHVFTLGAFEDKINEVRTADVGADDRWKAVLSIGSMGANFVKAYGLDAALLTGDQADLIAALKQETKDRFGSEDVQVLENADKMAAFTGLYMDRQIASITENYLEQEFRVAVGELRPELRVAMSIAEELQKAVTSGGTETGKWYRVLGSDVLRNAFETAYGLGTDFASMDLDLQVSAMKEFSFDLIGGESVDGYLDPDKQETFVRRYLTLAGTTTNTVNDATLSLFGSASASSILATIYSA